MTKEEQNDFIGSIVEPDKKCCEHNFSDNNHIPVYKCCLGCGRTLSDIILNPKRNTDYLTSDGIQLIKEWLVKNNKWVGFIMSVNENLIWMPSRSMPLTKRLCCLADKITDPELMVDNIIQYAKENKLGV